VIVRVVGSGDEPPREYPIALMLNSELAPQDDRMGLIDAVILVPPSAVAIELEIDGEVVDRFEASTEPPDIRAVRPLPAREDELPLALQVKRPFAAGQTYAIQVSTDRGRTWQTLGVGLREPTFTLQRTQFRPGSELQVRIIATNGFASREVRHDIRI
jgi:hypothetical protein